MFNGAHKTNIFITVCILVLLFYVHLYAYKLFFFKPVINYFRSSSDIYSVNNNGYIGTNLQIKILELGNSNIIIYMYYFKGIQTERKRHFQLTFGISF